MPQIGEIRKAKELTSAKSVGGSRIWLACSDCGKERWVNLRRDKPARLRCKSCAARQTQLKNRRTKAVGEHISYIRIQINPDDFFYPMARRNGQIDEHRLVMARHLNRCLFSWEVVHHKNGIKDDNRLENLELISDKRFHLVDLALKGQLSRLQIKVREQATQIEMLKAQLSQGGIN